MEIPLFISILLILILLTLSSILSATETALVAASTGKLHRLAKSGDRRAELVKKLRHSIEKVLGSILLCNTLLNSLATSLSTELFMELFGDKGVIYATTVMTSLIVIYAELLPKFLAFSNPERMALLYAQMINGVVKVFSPVASLMRWGAKSSLSCVVSSMMQMPGRQAQWKNCVERSIFITPMIWKPLKSGRCFIVSWILGM